MADPVILAAIRKKPPPQRHLDLMADADALSIPAIFILVAIMVIGAAGLIVIEFLFS
jgi:hypothetical protein